ncbi:hypothetical protein BMF94_0850 [Rhodotorula taiwanensis]|uniref:Frequency clock protein n=1 Tax=Rhodotorula taiwanensis TaxID=741276 RepID=A0A2S5BH85_9BASI|nr:hypothetical protein BMF94_0850 [Rhodotorula taiwanensis]
MAGGGEAGGNKLLPAIHRVRHDAWPDPQGRKVKLNKPALDSTAVRDHRPSSSESSGPDGSSKAVAGDSGLVTPNGTASPSHQQHHGQHGTGSAVGSASRRLGALGIPLSSSDEGDEDDDIDESEPEPSVVVSTNSLEGNAPGSPAVPIADPPAATYSRGGSTRSGPSTRSGESQAAGAFVSEESFRDIVDELTLQNQRLKQRLKRFESARVPNNLRNERLFEIRFFDGLPKQRRREIESFLTDYVQTLSSSGDHVSSSSSRINVTGGSSAHDHTESTSSIGATLRSLRSSEKEVLAKEAMAIALQGASISAAGQSASASGSGSGSGSGPDRKMRDRRKDSSGGLHTATMEPLGSVPTPPIATPTLPDPPPLLRRPTDFFPPERDVLAAPSFSGPEPRSLTGTGSGMRISDPTSKKRRRTPAATPAAPPSPERTSRLRRTASYDGSVTSDSIAAVQDPERLEGLVVELLERLFWECLPVEGAEEETLAPANPLHSDPQPLPAQSSTNTQYLRTMLFSEETQKSGGFLYLNLLATMAGLHRLNVSVGTVRHALRSRSHLLEMSTEGNKIRWKGPLAKPRPEPNDLAQPEIEMGDMEDNSIEATRMEGVEMAERRRDVRHHARPSVKDDATSTRSSGDHLTSMFGERPVTVARSGADTGSGSGQDPSRSKGSTAPTSLMPSGSGGSKNGSSSNGLSNGSREAQMKVHAAGHLGHEHPPLVSSSALRHTVEELSSACAVVPGDGIASLDILGSAVVQPPPRRVLYTPLFVRRNDPASDAESKDDDAPSEGSGVSASRPTKRRKEYEGGVVFFANDLFYSDLAGDLAARTSILKEAVRDDSLSFQAILGDSSSIEAEWSSRTGSAGAGSTSHTRSRSSASPVAADAPQSLFGQHVLPLARPLGNHLDEGKSSTGASVDANSAVSSIAGDAEPDLESWDAIDDLAIDSPPQNSAGNGEYDIFRITPYPALQVSAMHDAVADDHFTMHVKMLYARPQSREHAFPKRLRRSFASIVPASVAAPNYTLPLPRVEHLVTHTLNHHPSVCVRFPRLCLRESSVSDTDGEVRSALATGSISPTSSQLRRLPSVPGADYLMSLSLPLNAWAPETRRPSESDERGSEAVRTGTGTCESLITID